MKRPTVVGIGASAGGVEALRDLFHALPADTGAAFVVVVHLPPDRESKLASILGHCTDMRVVEMTDDGPHELEADVVYVVTPDCTLEIDDTQLKATPDAQMRNRRAPIDLFFRSLAVKHGDGFAVILSGSGSDGAVGAKAVKEAGGLVLVQDPLDAGHEGMPNAVIAKDIADVVAPIGELASRLAELLRQRSRLTPLITPDGGEAATEDEVEAVLKRIFDLVRARTGHDFSRYKRTTIVRRTARRMQLQHCDRISARRTRRCRRFLDRRGPLRAHAGRRTDEQRTVAGRRPAACALARGPGPRAPRRRAEPQRADRDRNRRRAADDRPRMPSDSVLECHGEHRPPKWEKNSS